MELFAEKLLGSLIKPEFIVISNLPKSCKYILLNICEQFRPSFFLTKFVNAESQVTLIDL